jgi:hypothetical protein
MQPVLKADAVASLLGYRCTASFHNKRAALEAAGFPRKLPGINGWSSAAILRWVETSGEDSGPPVPPPPAGNPLEARYAS